MVSVVTTGVAVWRFGRTRRSPDTAQSRREHSARSPGSTYRNRRPRIQVGLTPYALMVRLSTIVIVLAIVLGIGLIPIPVVPGVGLVVGISGVLIGIVLRLLGK